MPYAITQAADLLRVRLHGVLTTKSLMDLAAELAELEGRLPTAVSRIVDLRECTGIDVNFSAMLKLGQARTAVQLPNPVKSALLAPDPILYGFARMFQSLNANPSITIAIFPDEASALAWLHEPGLAPPARPWVPGG